MKKISLVLPCHNEAENIPLLVPEIIKNIPSKYTYEILLVDDGSSDSTPFVIAKLARNKKIKGIVLYTNFGHQVALRAGLEHATGNAVITMDADFQHPPQYLKKMLQHWEAGHDLIQMQKRKDAEPYIIRKTARKMIYPFLDWLTDSTLTPGVSDFGLIDKKIHQFIQNSPESEFFLRGVVKLVAHNPKTVKYAVGQRKHGQSSYTLRQFMNNFIAGFLTFSTKPLRITSLLGLVILLITGVFLVVDIIRALALGVAIIQGWITVVLLLLLLNGFIIFYLGMLGEYLGIIFRETKKRPKYLISKTINL